MTNLSRAIRDIADERDRQVRVEGWSADHDDGHTRGELAQAALCYVATSAGATRKLAAGYRPDVLADPVGYYGSTYRPLIAHEWPWGRGDFKPRNRRADLVRAGALIAAEIERLDREAGDEAQAELPVLSGALLHAAVDDLDNLGMPGFTSAKWQHFTYEAENSMGLEFETADGRPVRIGVSWDDLEKISGTLRAALASRDGDLVPVAWNNEAVSATWRCAAGRDGLFRLGLDTDNGTLRIDLSRTEATAVADALRYHLGATAGDQAIRSHSDKSSGSPSVEVSTPPGGENV